MTWKAQDYQCLDEEQNITGERFAKLQRKLIEVMNILTIVCRVSFELIYDIIDYSERLKLKC